MVAITIQAMDEFANLVRHMHQLHERDMGRQYFGFSPTDAFRPSVNLYETLQAFVICVDISGMDQNDIEVQLEKGNVVIRGRRQSPLPPDGSRAVAVHLMEIDHGTFCRTVEVPSGVDEENIAANYHLGMLWITLPKRNGK
ncbi:MAG TPA: Hsp20/alpha crystallin family protein [Phycisphaerae bacterium]|nr:Hsp20/alpha crystallin family protein [Phycisphaerae bacterium]